MHISSVLQESVAQYRWRKGIPAKGLEYGPLADLPDWSYADGRPAPIPHGKVAKIKLQKEYLDQVINLSKEVDKCLDLNRQKAAKEEDIRRKAKANFLKSKGQAFS
ncbi:39S ribosomal protein L52, mitochondrial [Caerostris extrusa]|uniref:Large ribosomal subunit protein mL52 n=1 Tax=Caerostris extrusa TaxID=172846 RepID=A0AAV4P6I5_CAEEX|nr:39S ribosomal protein L52, mitochondrial [Caerostris extrusa]